MTERSLVERWVCFFELVSGEGFVEVEKSLRDGGGCGEIYWWMVREIFFDWGIGFDEFGCRFCRDGSFLLFEELVEDLEFLRGGWAGGAVFEGVGDGGVEDFGSESDGGFDRKCFVEGDESLEGGSGSGSFDAGCFA